MILRRACDAIAVGGRPFAAALLACGWTGDPLADARHAAEILREVRGDAHNATWLCRGFTGPQIHILTEHWYGLTGCGFRHVWGWTHAELDEAARQLSEAGLAHADGLTASGRELRDEIEDDTDTQMLPIMCRDRRHPRRPRTHRRTDQPRRRCRERSAHGPALVLHVARRATGVPVRLKGRDQCQAERPSPRAW